jgi:hypothetical protein
MTHIQEEPQGLQADQENWTIELLPFRISFCFGKFRDFAQKSGEQEAKLIHHATLSFGKQMLHETVPTGTIIC